MLFCPSRGGGKSEKKIKLTFSLSLLASIQKSPNKAMPAPPPPSSSFSKQQRKKPPRHGSSLPLLAFAGAKKTTYDPRVAKQKASNLAAKRVNEFRKLKARLEAEGKLAVPSSIAKATMDAADGGRGGGEEEVRRREVKGDGLERRRRRKRRHGNIGKPTFFFFFPSPPSSEPPKNNNDNNRPDDASRLLLLLLLRRRHPLPLSLSTKAIRISQSRSTRSRG